MFNAMILDGTPGAAVEADLTSFGVPANQCFELQISATGGDGGNAPMGNTVFSSTGGEGEGPRAIFTVPATGRLVYITGQVGVTSSDETFAGGGGGSGVFYDPDGTINGNEVLLIVGAGGAGAHAVSNGGFTLTSGTTDLLADPQVFPSDPPPTGAAQAAAGLGDTSLGGAGGGGFGFAGENASSTVTGGMAATFAGVSLGGVGELGANGGAGFGGGGGGGPANQGNDMDPDSDDEDAGGGGGGYYGGNGGAYDDGFDPADNSTGRVYRSQGGASYINDLSGMGCDLALKQVDFFDSGGQGAGTGSDGAITINCLDVLPVELTNFTAEVQGNTVLLKWETASELNNEGFQVERSKDGQNWEILDFVKGAGTTIETQRYKYSDENPLNTTNYYRLKQIDSDGAYDYSKIVVAQMLTKSTDLHVFPNPANTLIEYQLSNTLIDEEHTISVYDWSGRLVREYQQSADGLQAIDISDLYAGTYTIIVSGDAWQYAKLIVKQ